MGSKTISRSKAVILFIVGLLLVILGFPTTFWLSTALDIIGIGIGVLMVLLGIITLVTGFVLLIKETGRTFSLALGIVLAIIIIAAIFIGMIVLMHMISIA